MKVQLRDVAFARSGDKGDTANIGLIARAEAVYPLLVEQVTARRVREHFRGVCHGEVERFELPNLWALNFLLHESLGGGGTVSLMLDAQGKTFSSALLRMEVDVPEDLLAAVRADPDALCSGRPEREGTVGRDAGESGFAAAAPGEGAA